MIATIVVIALVAIWALLRAYGFYREFWPDISGVDDNGPCDPIDEACGGFSVPDDVREMIMRAVVETSDTDKARRGRVELQSDKLTRSDEGMQS